MLEYFVWKVTVAAVGVLIMGCVIWLVIKLLHLLLAFNAVKSGGRSGKGDARLCHTPDKVILSICVAHEVNNLKEGIRNHVPISQRTSRVTA